MKIKTPQVMQDKDGKDSSSRMITIGLVVVAQVFLFLCIFLTEFTIIEIGSMYGTIMGFAWTFKTQGKMGENRELRIKADVGETIVKAEIEKPAA